MREIKSLVVACCGGLILYIAVFGWAIWKPLTIGFIADSVAIKKAYAARFTAPKLVFIAGSNGLFSHRCQVMEPIIGRPCLNASVTAELGLAYMLEIGRTMLRRGDTALLPLEYGTFESTKAKIDAGRAHPFRVTYDRSSLIGLPPGLVVRAIFQFDLRYLLGAVAEMSLQALGISRRFGTEMLTPQGDMSGQTAAKGKPYRAAILKTDFWLKPNSEYIVSDGARDTIFTFLEWASDNGVRVIGTLPTTFDDRPVDDALVARLRRIYETRGHAFLLLSNRSQYPRACFFDTQYHLIESCQVRHSRTLARAIRPALEQAR